MSLVEGQIGPAGLAAVTTKAASDGSSETLDYPTLYSQLQASQGLPDFSVASIDGNQTMFQDMYLDLGQIKQKVVASGANPLNCVVYADVLSVPDGLKWTLQKTSLTVYARRIEVGSSVQIFLDFRESHLTRLVIYVDELVGSLDVLGVVAGQAAPVTFRIGTVPSAGFTVGISGDAPKLTPMAYANGLPLPVTEFHSLALNHSFLLGSLLYDTKPRLALSIFSWVKDWSSAVPELAGLFLRSSSIVALLSSQINAAANGSVFVPYLTAGVYQSLAQAFVNEAKQYESDYQQLSTQKVVTDENIQLAKTLLANAQSQSTYVDALRKQALSNYDSASAAVLSSRKNFRAQQTAVDVARIQFEQVGLPEYERKMIADAIFGLVQAVVTFGVAIGEMAAGDEAAAPSAAEGAAADAEAVAQAAKTGADTAKQASALANQMKQLKSVVEALGKLYDFSAAIVSAAGDIASAQSMVAQMQGMDIDTSGADLTASSQWDIFKLQTDAVLQVPVDAGIGGADDYKQAFDILIIQGQALVAAQVAAIQAGQEYARVVLQQQMAQQQQANLQRYVAELKVGDALIASMMQQFYQIFLDAKSSLLAALENYRASYFYWALAPSSVKPTILDPVNSLDTGLKNLTAMAMDNAQALSNFNPAPTRMADAEVEIATADVLASLAKNGTATWVIDMGADAFVGLGRVRIGTVRVWLEGAKLPAGKPIRMAISTSGGYRDRLGGTSFQFTAAPLVRGFQYHVSAVGGRANPDWTFANGDLGFIEMDGSVAGVVSYAYFEPTPFTAWTITVKSQDNPGVDVSQVSRITMQFQGMAIMGGQS